MNGLLNTFRDAKEYGSILLVDRYDWELLDRFVSNTEKIGQISMYTVGLDDTAEALKQMIAQGKVLAQKYHVTTTNPPYMALSNASGKLFDYVKNNYSDSKADLFSVFIERCISFSKHNGYTAMITQHAWLFLSSFEKLRTKLQGFDYINMAHLGARAFDEIGGEVVQTVSFVCRITNIANYKGTFHRLINGQNQGSKEKLFLAGKDVYFATKENFTRIPGGPIAYWVGDNIYQAFSGKLLSDYALPRVGCQTSDNNRFLRSWYEVDHNKFNDSAANADEAVESGAKWFPYNKGGSFRRWYGNNELVINWEKDGKEVKDYATMLYKNSTRTVKNVQFYFREEVTWSTLASGLFSARYCKPGFLIDTKGSAVFFDDRRQVNYCIAFLNSCIAQKFLEILSPTLDYSVGAVGKLPYKYSATKAEEIDAIVESCIECCKQDWDSFETSWDFECHPLVKKGISRRHWNNDNVTIQECFQAWSEECDHRFEKLKSSEEDLNRIFISIYGMQDEMKPDVEDKDITVRRADRQRDIRSLLSYAVGCMFGRYSLSSTGLTFAGGEWDERIYGQFKPDGDNIIPISDEEYLEDDIVFRLCAFLKVAFGEETLEENLDYIAKTLGNKGNSSREIIRNYYLNDFFKEHCQAYSATGAGKRPIYWLFDSGKQNGFKALIYMHRYNADTIGNLRIDYLHRMQRVYESEISRMQDMIDHSTSAREVTQANKRREKLTKQLKECREYDEKLAHLALSRIELDLDDGVKKNYRKIQTSNDGKFYEVLADSKNIMAKE